MDIKVPLSNKPLAKKRKDQLDGIISGDEQLLFYIVCDLSVEEKYSDTVFAATEKRIICCDESFDGGFLSVPYTEIISVRVKRMYGNAALLIKRNGEENCILRYTYAISSLVDAIAGFIKGITDGKSCDEAIGGIEAAFEKSLNVCPVCGRPLLHPGAECIKCASKGKMFSKLAKYIMPHKKSLLFCLFLSVITTGVTLVPPYATKVLVDKVIPEGNKHLLYIIVLILLGTYIVQFGIGGIKGYLLRKSGDKIVMELRNDVFERAQKLPMNFYDKTSTGSVINRIGGDTGNIQSFMLRVTQEVVVQFFMLIGIVIIMLTMNWKLTLLSLIPVPFVVIGARKFEKKIRPFYRRIWRKWTAVSSILTDSIPCIKVVKSFASEKRAVDRFSKQNEEWRKTSTSSAKITNTFPAVVSFAITFGGLLIWSVGGTSVIDSGGTVISLGLLVSFLSYTSMFYGPVSFFANFNDSYQSALASAERLFDILDAEPEQDFGAGNKPANVNGKIEFRNVNFSFDKTKQTLSDINLTIEAGDIVGIVGTTGSGKSTLINLLMRFYSSYDGKILLDGKDIKDIDLEYYRSRIGYVQQEPMMFSDTIFNNIAYGSPEAPVEAVIHAADIANAHSFIINQPDAYDTVLGERGVGLSGGEKQRISIARAVLKNPSILIFDEATAAVDSETESLIQEAIDRLIRGRTTLMIAHRLSTLRKANKIVVVDNGKIIECGSHDELMEKRGKYYRLIQIQSMASAGTITNGELS